MTDVESFRRDLRAFLEHELPEKLGELPPNTAEYWGGRKPELPHPNSARYCELMAERGLTAPTWPKEYGGGGLDPAQAQGARAGARAAAAAAAAHRLRPVDDRPDAAAVRQRGAEARAPAEDHPRRDPLVPGLLRAQRRQRPRVARRPRRASRATSWSSTARRSGPATATSPTGCSCWCAPTRSAKKQEGITFVLIDMNQPGVRGAADQADQRRLAVLRDVLHRRARAR